MQNHLLMGTGMSKKNTERAKELEAYLNQQLGLAQAYGKFPMPVTMGLSTVYFCTNSEAAQKWKDIPFETWKQMWDK